MSANTDRAWQLFGMSRLDLAEKELYDVLQWEPNDTMAHAMLGMVLARRGEFSRAHEEIDSAIGLDPGLAYAHFVRSCTLGWQKKYPAAQEAILEALRLSPNDPDYHDHLSWTELCLNRIAPALKAAEAGLRINPQHAGCLNSLAMALSDKGEWKKAVDIMEQALKLEPTSSRLHTNLGWIHHQANHPDFALAHFCEGLRLEPESVSSRDAFTAGVHAAVNYWRMQTAFWAFCTGFGLTMCLCAINQVWSNSLVLLCVGTMGLLVSNTFVFQLRSMGRSLLSEQKRIECRWMNGGLVVAVVLGLMVIGQGKTDSFEGVNHFLGAVVCFASAASVALFFDCRPGWLRKLWLGSLLLTVAGLLGYLAIPDAVNMGDTPEYRLGLLFNVSFWFLIVSVVVINIGKKADPYAAIRGLVIREGLLRRAALPVPETTQPPSGRGGVVGSS